jgi:alkylated DNA repair protein (DNA oxidative demethylase)
MIELAAGLLHYPAHLSPEVQQRLVEDLRGLVSQAPLFTPRMPRTGKAFSVAMTNCGPLGWVSDQAGGYRYQSTHPLTHQPWPPMPQDVLDLWNELAHYPQPPEACLINFYTADARMGLHQDRDEADISAPVVSVSLGDSCLFRFGSSQRGGRTQSVKLMSGDVVIIGGPSRLCFHGVDRIYPNTSALLKDGGRINLTLRRVN